PLCTAGYGLAKANWEYFLGAMYLFTINAIFIALATFLVLKVLKFPMLKYANSQKRRLISRVATLLAIVVMIPAIWTFVTVLNQSNFERDASIFINNEMGALPHSEYIVKNSSYDYNDGKDPVIVLNSFGLDEIPESTIALLEDRLKNYSSLSNATLRVNQNRSRNLDNLKYMEQIRYRDSIDLRAQRQRIVFLEDRLKKLETLERNTIPFEEFSRELKINYKAVKHLSFSNVISSNFKKIDTLSVFTVKWNDSLISTADIPK